MPRYVEIAEDLIARIRAGVLAPGSTLPGELTLMEEYQSSRHTIRDALRRLEELGLIERRRGIGTRVRTSRSAKRRARKRSPRGSSPSSTAI